MDSKGAERNPVRGDSKDPWPLAELQRLVATAVRRREPIAHDERLAEAVGELVAGSARLSPVAQLEIYREQFWRRHLESLEEDFPSLLALLGRPGFTELAMTYLEAFPPRSFDLRRLGASVAAFVRTRPPYADDPLLHEAARYDWAFMEAFDAPEGLPFDPSSLATVPEDAWGRARIRFQPSVRPIALSYPLYAFRLAARRGETSPRPAPQAERVVVYRNALLIYSHKVDPLAFELLTLLQGGAELGHACESVATANGVAQADELSPRVAEWFQEWTALGWLRSVSFD